MTVFLLNQFKICLIFLIGWRCITGGVNGRAGHYYRSKGRVDYDVG